MDRILTLVCERTGVKPEEVKSPWRKRKVADTRKLFWLSAKKHPLRFTIEELGDFVGRDHATVSVGIRTAEDLIVTNRNFRSFALSVDEAMVEDTLTNEGAFKLKKGKVEASVYDNVPQL